MPAPPSAVADYLGGNGPARAIVILPVRCENALPCMLGTNVTLVVWSGWHNARKIVAPSCLTRHKPEHKEIAYSLFVPDNPGVSARWCLKLSSDAQQHPIA